MVEEDLQVKYWILYEFGRLHRIELYPSILPSFVPKENCTKSLENLGIAFMSAIVKFYGDNIYQIRSLWKTYSFFEVKYSIKQRSMLRQQSFM